MTTTLSQAALYSGAALTCTPMQLRHRVSSPQLVAHPLDPQSDVYNANVDASRKRSKFSLFGGRPGEELERSGSNDLKRYLFERRNPHHKTSSAPVTTSPTSFHSPRLSVVGRPSSKATSVLGIGIEAGTDQQRSWWRNRSARSSSRNSIISVHSANSDAEQPVSHQPANETVSAPVTGYTTPRARSRHGKSSRPSTSRPSTSRSAHRQFFDRDHPPPISSPRNFVHVTHTGPQHFEKMNSATENELLTEFSAVRAAQSPRRTLLGIKVGNLSSRNNSVDEGAPSMTTASTRSSYYHNPKSPGMPELRHNRSLRSKGSFSVPYREGDPHAARRASSRGSVSSRSGTMMSPMPLEDLPPLPNSSFTSARGSVCMDSAYGDDEMDTQWCHAVTCDDEVQSIAASEGIAITADEPVHTPVTPSRPKSPGVRSFSGRTTPRARSPTRSEPSSRSSTSLPPPPRNRSSLQDSDTSTLRQEASTPVDDATLPVSSRSAHVKRASMNGLFSSWHADSDSDEDAGEPLESIAEDPLSDDDKWIVDEPTLPADRSSPLPLEIPQDSDVPVEDMIEEPPSAVLDEVGIESAKELKVTAPPVEEQAARPVVKSEKRATVVIGSIDTHPVKDDHEPEERSTRSSAPSRKNSGKTVRFKEDLCSFIREEVARRHQPAQPSREESVGQVQASLEDLEATLARLEAEIAGASETPAQKPKEPSPVRAKENSKPSSRKSTEGPPVTKGSTNRTPAKRPLSENLEKQATLAPRNRARTPEVRAAYRYDSRRRNSYDDRILLERTAWA